MEEDEVQYQTNSARSFSEDRSDETGTNSAQPEKTRKVPKIAIKPHNRSSVIFSFNKPPLLTSQNRRN